jgi:Protein of unknown function (DUF1566)
MKGIYLFLLLLVFCSTINAPPALSNETSLTAQQQTLLLIITEFLLSENESPATVFLEGDQSNVSTTGTNSTTITVVSTGPNEIVVQTADGFVFNLTKIGPSGAELAADADGWSCIRDNLTGLTWEIKTSNSGLHHQDDSFSWHNTTATNNISGVGFADNSGATCSGYVAGDPSTYCNTQAYVARVNNNGWCGYQDWRMPSINELSSIISLNKASPDLYANMFPKGTSKAVWSATPVSNYTGFSWHIYINDGYAHGNDQSGNLPVLLVRNARP